MSPTGGTPNTQESRTTRQRGDDPLTRSGTVEVRDLDGGGRTYELSFSSEEPYLRCFGPEILDHGRDACDLSRLQEIGVVLFNHDRDRVIGKITRAWIEDGRGKAEIQFDSDPESEAIRQKVDGGTLKGVSVGYQVSVWEDVAAGESSSDGRFEGPCSIARRWMPYEVSIVSVPADATVGVGRELEGPISPTPQQKEAETKRTGPSLRERYVQYNQNRLKGGIHR